MTDRSMSPNQMDSIRFHARCSYRFGRAVEVAVRQIQADWGHYDNVADIVRREYDLMRRAEDWASEGSNL